MDVEEDLSFSPNDYLPQLVDWYQGSGTYSGSASLSVHGVVKTTGLAEVSWNDLGETTFSMNLEAHEFSLAHELFEADEISIRMETSDGGLFTAERAFAVNNQLSFGSAGSTSRVHLTAARSVYTATATDSVYWVIPAVNFVADLWISNSNVAKHPLRIYSTPAIPPELNSNERLLATIAATSKDKLVPFLFAEKDAFIEKLPDYTEKFERLEKKQADHLATSVIIGAIPDGVSLSLHDVLGWLPSDIFYALSIATGTYVGSGFVELRSSDKRLTKRYHVSSRCPAYRKGQTFVEDPVCATGHSAYAELIERVLATFPSKKYLKSVANNVVAGTQHDLVEDSTDFYVRALESLTKAAGVSSQNLLDGVQSTMQARVLSVISQAGSDIASEAAAARTSGDVYAYDRLTTISARMRSTAQVEKKFGLAVSALLAAKGLQDEAVVNAYLGTKNPPTSWADFLSKTRGAVIHEGMIDLPTREALFEMHSLLRHLSDVILRLFALEVGYSSKYLPRVARWARDAKPLNWVDSSTTPADLRL